MDIWNMINFKYGHLKYDYILNDKFHQDSMIVFQ